MGQKEVFGTPKQGLKVFVELRIDDLVKDRLLWQAQLGKSPQPSSNLPNVIHTLESSLRTIRSAK